jgi:hypothetical protein
VNVSQFRIRSFQPGQLSQWLSCGWRLLRRRPLEAMRPAAAFALGLLLLRAIPVIGDVVLLLLLPSVIASYALHLHLIALTGTAPRPRRRGGPPAYRRWGRELRDALFGAWTKHENIFPLILVGLVLGALGLVIQVLFSEVAGQAAVSPYGFFELTTAQMVRLLLAYGAGAVLWIVVMTLLLWTLPLFVLRDVVLLEALGWNLRALFRNAVIVLLLLGALATGLVPATLLKLWSPIAHVAVQWLSLTLLAALFGCSAYCSYRLVLADAESAPRPAAPSSARVIRGTRPAPPVARRS